MHFDRLPDYRLKGWQTDTRCSLPPMRAGYAKVVQYYICYLLLPFLSLSERSLFPGGPLSAALLSEACLCSNTISSGLICSMRFIISSCSLAFASCLVPLFSFFFFSYLARGGLSCQLFHLLQLSLRSLSPRATSRLYRAVRTCLCVQSLNIEQRLSYESELIHIGLQEFFGLCVSIIYKLSLLPRR